MSTPFLGTKLLIPPVRPELVSRPRLIERLDAGLSKQSRSGETPSFARKLTLISAPAGFGKTTLLSEWAQALDGASSSRAALNGASSSRAALNGASSSGAALDTASPPRAVAWLSLDESDNEPTRFLAYLIAALQRVEAHVGKRALSILRSPQPPPAEAVITSLINEVAEIPGRILLVLDDYHVIEARAIHDILTFLVAHLPPQMHLVVATRIDPIVPLARLRASGKLTELRAADLRFSASEAAEFLNRVMGLDLSAEDVGTLEARTEGWIAGLQLAAISVRGQEDATRFIKSFSGSHRLVLDYLIEEVLEQQSEDVQTFLLQTAVLDRLTGSLCDAVRFGNAESAHGEDSGHATLEMLERANLFIVPLDAERRWYRYHELFADLLRRQLRHTEPGSIPTLHRRASAWYEQKGLADEAIDHALRGEDFEKAARLIEGRADAMWQHGQHAKLRRWLDELPVELMLSKPHLCILRAWMFFTSGQQDAAEQSLEAAEKALRVGAELAVDTAPGEQGRLSPSERMKIQGRAATIRAFLAFYRGDTRGTDEYARQALDYLPEDDLTWRSAATVALGDAYSFVGDLAAACRVRSEALDLSQAAGNIYIVLIASMKLAVTLRQQGRLEQVIEICRRQLRLANRSGLSQTDVVGWLLAIQSEVLAERDDLEEALDKAECGTELTKRGTDLATLGWSYLCLVRILFSIGDYHAAGEAVRRMEEIAGESYVPPWITSIGAAWRARIWLAQGNLEAALQWAEERGLNPDAPPPYLFESEYVALARILVAQGRLDEAAKLLQRLLEAAEKRGHTSRTIEVLVLQGMAFQAAGDTEEALTALERALTLAEPEGFVRTFVDEGPPVGRLLYEAAKGELAPDYARRLLAAFPAAETEQTVGPDTQDARHEMIELLSRRELQVLQLIAEGLTNREIAARLFLSLNTVKVHTRNIYGKLNVHSRTQAVARSQAMGLLPRA